MKKFLCLMMLLPLMHAALADGGEDARQRNRYALAERFTEGKLRNMLFSTTVDPNWFKSGEKFW